MVTAPSTPFSLDSLLLRFFEHQTMVKLYHFQTKRYGAHKAADAYYAKFLANLDRFMEVAQGIYGTVGISNWKLDDTAVTDADVDKRLKEFAKLLVQLNAPFAEHQALLSVRDEMLADVNQLRYLLTFQ